MKILIRLVFSAACIAILLFCWFGFMCTVEPLHRPVQITWRAVYIVVGPFAIAGVVLLNRPRKKSNDPD